MARLDREIGSTDSEGFECLYLNKLPFQDDLRDYPFENFNEVDKFKPTLGASGCCRFFADPSRRVQLTRLLLQCNWQPQNSSSMALT